MTDLATTDLLSTSEAIGVLFVSRWTLARMVKRGDITPVHRLAGGAMIFRAADVEQLAAERAAS